jgi:aldehyde:ferredoxin oxidoreductase
MREGMTRMDDTLPPRVQQYFVSGQVNEEPLDPEVVNEAVGTFYGMMGWDKETGVPTLEKLQELDIEWVHETTKDL